MTEQELKSALNTYNNAILISMLLGDNYKKGKISTSQYFDGILSCQLIILANISIFINNGIHKS